MNILNTGQRNIKLTVEYDGTNYHGWQSQINAVSIQDTLEHVLAKVTGHSVSIIGAGRTDAGVHALGQVANFLTTCSIPIEKIPYAFNAVLPRDIVIKNACVMHEDFHSRYLAKGKKYKYIINNSKFPSAIQRSQEYFCPYKLDYKLMYDTLKLFVGEHDFKGFAASGSTVRNTKRIVYTAEMKKEQDRIVIELSGNGFLYNMVRIIVGTLVDVGRGKIAISDVEGALVEGDRSRAGVTLPPQGLYLVEVYY